MGHFIGLGFLAEGPARVGHHIRMVDHVRGNDVLVEVCDPYFFDPEGGRARG